MPKIFCLDGKSHAVATDDVLIIKGPGEFVGKTTGRRVLRPFDTITMTFESLMPGEAVTITTNVFPVTTFFRPHEGDIRSLDQVPKQLIARLEH